MSQNLHFSILERFMGMHIFDCFQGLCYLEIGLPLIWFWLMRSRSSLLSSSGIVSELGSASGSRFRMEKFSGISGIRGSIAWLCLFNVLKSLFTCGFKGLKNWERVAWWLLPIQGSRLILPTGRTFATNFLSWSHEHIIWSQFFSFFFATTFD